MEYRKSVLYLKRLIIFALLITAVLSTTALADKESRVVTVTKLDPSVYEVSTATEVAAAVKKDNKVAGVRYRKQKIALIGTVEEVKGEKNIYLKNDESSLVLKINCSSIKRQLEGIAPGDRVFALGKVSTVTDKSFILNAQTIQKTDSEWDYVNTGITDANGRYYDSSSYSVECLIGIEYIELKSWEASEAPKLVGYPLRNEIEKGIRYDLGDDEVILIFSLDWDKLNSFARESADKIAKKEVIKRVYENLISPEGSARNFLANELQLDRVHRENIGDKKTDNLTFKYYIDSSRIDDSIRGEFFTVRIGDDRYVAVLYRHGDNAKHAQEVAMFLGSIKKADR